MAKSLRMTWLLCLTMLLAGPAGAQESLEDKTPRIQNSKVPVETIADKRALKLRLAGVIRPRAIRKTGRVSLKLEKPERPVSEAFKKKMEAKEAAKRKLEETKSKGGAEARAADEAEPKAGLFDISSNGGNPPDNTVAVSRTGFIVAADNSRITFFREDGSRLESFSYPDFYDSLDDSIGTKTADPRVIYDPEENRFVFFMQSGNSSSESVCLLAFSTSDDPREDWNVYSFNHIEDDRLWFDYPSLSINWREVFLTGNLFSNRDDFSGNIVYMIQKDDGYAAREMDALAWRDVRAGSVTASGIVAVTPSGAGMYGPGHYMVSTSARGGSDVFLYHVTGHIEDDPRLERHTIDVTDYEQAGSAAQQGTTQRLDIGDCRVKSAYYQKGKVYFAFGKDDGNGFNGIAFYRITVSDLSVASKFFHDNQNSDYSYPAIANRGGNDANSSAILVFQQSGKNTFPRIRVRRLKSNMSAVSSSTTLKRSASFSQLRRWGDYITIQRKYGRPVAWATGHTAGSDNNWRSHLIQIDLP